MKRVLCVFLCSVALASSSYQTGKLLSITDSSSNRIVSNSQNGSVDTVTDVEYRLSVQIGDMVYVGSYWPRWRWRRVAQPSARTTMKWVPHPCASFAQGWAAD